MRVAASIVTYNPDLLRLEECISRVIYQVDMVIIIDNNSENIDKINRLLLKYSSNKYIQIRNKRNMGLAFALNQALEIADKSGYDWLITMDQDSILAKEYVLSCKEFLCTHKELHVGIITPRIVDRNALDQKIKGVTGNEIYNEVTTCITSGSFTNVKAAIRSGGFDNYLFIDNVDFDLCFKLRENGFKCIRINKLVLLHELGSISKHTFMGRTFYTTNHSPLRLFYIYRNYFILIRNHWRLLKQDSEVRRWFKLQGLGLILVKPAKILLAEKQKLKKIIAIANGILHGIAYFLIPERFYKRWNAT